MILGLPKSTKVFNQLPKKQIFEQFRVSPKERKRFDDDIGRLAIVNEISPKTVNLDKGTKVDSIFFVRIELKNKEYDRKNLILISKLIDQSMIFILEWEEQQKIAVYETELIESDWHNSEDFKLKIEGINLDSVWNNFIIGIGGIVLEDDNTLIEQISLDTEREKLQERIDALDKRVRKEMQPKKKRELWDELKSLRKELEGL
ncbi:MAG: DUF4391 domain-containing protein [Candidatus Methanomethylophilaceae archaeon]|jgi:hypothetical protein